MQAESALLLRAIRAVVVHADAEGVDTLRHALASWLRDMQLLPAGNAALVVRYIGYYEPYAISHDALDKDEAPHEEARNASRSLMATVKLIREGKYVQPDEALHDPRPK